jgi:hypothetical protein
MNLGLLRRVTFTRCKPPPYALDFSYELITRMLAVMWLPGSETKLFLRRELFTREFLSPTSKLPFNMEERAELVVAGTQGLIRLPVPNYGAIRCEVVTDLPLLKHDKTLPCDLVVFCKLGRIVNMLGANF